MFIVKKKGRRRLSKFSRLVIITVLVILIVAFRLTEEIGPELTPEFRFLITRVIDGDSMELSGGDRVRLLGIDCPERGEKYYDAAKDFLTRHAVGRIAELKYGWRRRDGYGRLLGYLYIDSLFINRALVDSGLASVYLFKDNDLGSAEIMALISAQRNAIERKVGKWSIEYEPENSYINLDGSLRLHRPACRSVANRRPGKFQEFDNRDEGLALGLSSCRNCRP